MFTYPQENLSTKQELTGSREKALSLFEYINGCYYNVVGLPLVTLYKILLKTGINIWG
jgi:predicted house-cleaning NTP pyrophosphatase (Maf/HAM1 superfamily)